MFNVCTACGVYRADKKVRPIADEPTWAEAICPACGHVHRFRRLPLLVVAGASGTGKTAICRRLAGTIAEVVPLEADILWRREFNTPEDDYRAFGETWLRLVKNIAQAARPVVLFGAGLGVPANLEHCVERRYVDAIHRLALTCSPDELKARLHARPAWRGVDAAFIARQLEFNRWFVTTGPRLKPPIALLDTTAQPIEATVDAVRAWVRATLAQELCPHPHVPGASRPPPGYFLETRTYEYASTDE
ncbi:MAG: nucleoside kinase [Anaerolineae bacterium]|nr:nucleoside kinase [Anaerolineae bacterium]